MAGIGFELRKILRRDTYFDTLRAYGYAGIISAGPWVTSIIGILILGFLHFTHESPDSGIVQFQTSVTYLIAFSLIFSGFLQHSFTRYISDRLFENAIATVVPNFNGLILLMTVFSGSIGFFVASAFFPDQTVLYRSLMIGCFVILSNIWVATNLLSGLKNYNAVLIVFLLGYAVILGCAYFLRGYKLEGLLLSFFAGHFILFTGMLFTIYRYYPTRTIIDFDFLKPGRMYDSLIFGSFLYNLGIWADKLIFWFNPSTSTQVIGPLRISVIYDIPIFLAYLSIIPGMAVFLFRMETDFVEYYDQFYTAIREGYTLTHINEMHKEMVSTAKQGIIEIMKVQAFVIFIIFSCGDRILHWLGISTLYIHLLHIDVIAVSLQVVFLGLLNVFFYLDKRLQVVALTLLFLVCNTVLTLISIHLGAFFYGYGFALALLIACVAAMLLLDYDFDQLLYETFMLQ